MREFKDVILDYEKIINVNGHEIDLGTLPAFMLTDSESQRGLHILQIARAGSAKIRISAMIDGAFTPECAGKYRLEQFINDHREVRIIHGEVTRILK